MLGEIALWSFVVLLLTGTFLTFWFQPSMGETTYNGSYTPLNGLEMSQAYASTLDISFDIRGGLLIRQIHHWAAALFVAAMIVHMLRVMFTGAYRKPREINWLIGLGLLLAGTRRGLRRLLAARRPAVRHRPALRRRPDPVDPDRRLLPRVLHLRRRVPRRRHHPAPLHGAHPADPGVAPGAHRRAHAAARLPQAHAVAWPWTHREERRRLPDAPGLRRQGGWILLRGLRLHRI